MLGVRIAPQPPRRVLRVMTRVLLALGVFLLAYECYAVVAARIALPGKIAPFVHGPAELTGLSKARLDVIVKVQDPAFERHSGVEWPSPLTTTTITQGLVKRLFFEDFRPGFLKLEQTLIAWLVVNPGVSKSVQLRAFVELAYFGHPKGQAVIGFNAAAMAWFQQPLDKLSNDQFLALLAMLPAPKVLVPGTAESAERVSRIKRLLDGRCNHTRIADIQLQQCRAG
jgi:monofunctional glycosyltransferase